MINSALHSTHQPLSSPPTHTGETFIGTRETIFAEMGAVPRIWVIPAIHGDAARLHELHLQLSHQLQPDDRLLYTGNYIGHGTQIVETIDELLQFKQHLIDQCGFNTEHIIYLRGAQEEMWRKLLQLQYAPNPRDILAWLLANGVGATITAYGGNVIEMQGAAREGVRGLTYVNNRLRQTINSHPGHDMFLSGLYRAAYTMLLPAPGAVPLLFVHSGIDPTRPLAAQNDSFWWGGGQFGKITEQFDAFARVIRGYDPSHNGYVETEFTATIDAGCGFGGPLCATLIDGRTGHITNRIIS